MCEENLAEDLNCVVRIKKFDTYNINLPEGLALRESIINLRYSNYQQPSLAREKGELEFWDLFAILYTPKNLGNDLVEQRR